MGLCACWDCSAPVRTCFVGSESEGFLVYGVLGKGLNNLKLPEWGSTGSMVDSMVPYYGNLNCTFNKNPV